MSYEEFKSELMKDSDVQAEYAALAPEYERVRIDVFKEISKVPASSADKINKG